MRSTTLLIVSLLLCHCKSTAGQSDAKLVGGTEATESEYPATFIWTTGNSALTESYCTGSKVGINWILTAAHCVLQQSALPGETYLGPWSKTEDFVTGQQLTFSFDRNLDGNHLEETMTIMELRLPPLINDCLANRQRNPRLCQYREPIPDVALIRVNPQPSSQFATTVPANIDTSRIEASELIVMMGYGSETESYTGPPRLKYAARRVATSDELQQALQGTYAEDDGYPNWDFFFGTASDPAASGHVNLGFGDSGGPVYRAATNAIVGVNSDGFCPRGNRDCSTTTNSTFARLDDQGTHGVGLWLKSVLNPR